VRRYIQFLGMKSREELFPAEPKVEAFQIAKARA